MFRNVFNIYIRRHIYIHSLYIYICITIFMIILNYILYLLTQKIIKKIKTINYLNKKQIKTLKIATVIFVQLKKFQIYIFLQKKKLPQNF